MKGHELLIRDKFVSFLYRDAWCKEAFRCLWYVEDFTKEEIVLVVVNRYLENHCTMANDVEILSLSSCFSATFDWKVMIMNEISLVESDVGRASRVNHPLSCITPSINSSLDRFLVRRRNYRYIDNSETVNSVRSSIGLLLILAFILLLFTLSLVVVAASCAPTGVGLVVGFLSGSGSFRT